MKVSKYFIFSLREAPKDAESKSHIILTKGGYIKRLAAGIYDFTPLGFKLLKNVEKIIREEMEKVNCFEVLLPIMNPSEIWKETGRWYVYGKEMIRFKDRNERDFCLAPTHEEIIVDLVRFAISSWRELPFSLFQIGPKFRDEARPRFGIIRAREFIMKDAYSFDRTEEEAEKTYWKFYKAYERIFERMKLDVIPVQAAVGAIGGKFSHEFIFLTEYGEDKIMECQKCKFISKKEISSFFVNVDEKMADLKRKTSTVPPKSKVYTPSTTTVEELAKFLKIPTSKIIKSFFVKTESGKYYLCLVRGDRQISEDKLAKVLEENFELAGEEDVRKIFGAGKGFIGPLKYKGKIIVDRTVLDCVDGVAGADEDDYHYINVVPGRDFPINEIYDIAYAEEGDICPECREGILKEKIGLELGHVFYLGRKYSEPMDLTYTDKNKEKRFVVMGCYGIGVSRTIAALAEKFGYENGNGVAFPPEVAPFKVHIIPINMKDETILAAAEKIHAELEDISLLDDREDMSPGEKFADCDLWGAPIKIVLGKTLKEKGKIEVINRLSKDKIEIDVQNIKEKINEILHSL